MDTHSSGASAPEQVLTPVSFRFNTLEVRTIDRDGQIWFVASDVARALGYADAAQMTRWLDEDEKGLHNLQTPGGAQEVTILSESGLYHALLKSRRPEAKPFRRWVTSEVLPAIRRQGRYGAGLNLALANALAAEAGEAVARAVMDVVMSRQDGRQKLSRMMITLAWDDNNNPAMPFIDTIDSDVMLVSLADLPHRMLESNGVFPSDKMLADLAAACNQRLSRRIAHRDSSEKISTSHSANPIIKQQG